jgi:transposase
MMDESGVSDRPLVRRTWSPRGRTPVVPTKGGWKRRSVIGAIGVDAGGRRPDLLLMTRKGTVKAPDILEWLRELKRYARKKRKKVVLLWDGLAAHKARSVREWTEQEVSWLTIHRFPSYAPELNPQELVWASMKTKDFAGRLFDSLADMDNAIKKSGRRLKRRPDILRGCLTGTGLW